MNKLGLVVILCTLPGAGSCVSAAADDRQLEVARCGDLTHAEPGSGARYEGAVTSDVFELTAVIPAGLAGWGAAQGAPFHGFAIFLPHSGCILFEIHLRVDEDQRRGRPSSAREVRVGNVRGWEQEASGVVGGTSWANVRASLSSIITTITSTTAP